MSVATLLTHHYLIVRHPVRIDPHVSTGASTGNPHACSPSDQQASYTIVVRDTKSVSPNRWHGRGRTDDLGRNLT